MQVSHTQFKTLSSCRSIFKNLKISVIMHCSFIISKKLLLVSNFIDKLIEIRNLKKIVK